MEITKILAKKIFFATRWPKMTSYFGQAKIHVLSFFQRNNYFLIMKPPGNGFWAHFTPYSKFSDFLSEYYWCSKILPLYFFLEYPKKNDEISPKNDSISATKIASHILPFWFFGHLCNFLRSFLWTKLFSWASLRPKRKSQFT